MYPRRTFNQGRFIHTYVALGLSVAFTGIALAGSAVGQPTDVDRAPSPLLLAQIRPAPLPVPPPLPLPLPLPTPLPTPTPLPSPTPLPPPTPLPTPPISPVPHPPPPVLSPPARALLPCQVTTADGAPTGNCDTRLITSQDLYRDFHSCHTGKCYATKFLQLERLPMVVIYPAAIEERQLARAELRAEMAQGVQAMGTYLTDRAKDGGSDLPSIEGIHRLVQQAIDDIDNIDQPIGETRDERRRRLGLGSSLSSLAKTVRNS